MSLYGLLCYRSCLNVNYEIFKNTFDYMVFALFEIAVFLAFNIISFIWDFKFIKWSSMFYAKYTWNGTPYVDRTPWDTFKRHYSVIL